MQFKLKTIETIMIFQKNKFFYFFMMNIFIFHKTSATKRSKGESSDPIFQQSTQPSLKSISQRAPNASLIDLNTPIEDSKRAPSALFFDLNHTPVEYNSYTQDVSSPVPFIPPLCIKNIGTAGVSSSNPTHTLTNGRGESSKVPDTNHISNAEPNSVPDVHKSRKRLRAGQSSSRTVPISFKRSRVSAVVSKHRKRQKVLGNTMHRSKNVLECINLQLTVENNESISDMIDNVGLSIHIMKDDDDTKWSVFEKSDEIKHDFGGHTTAVRCLSFAIINLSLSDMNVLSSKGQLYYERMMECVAGVSRVITPEMYCSDDPECKRKVEFYFGNVREDIFVNALRNLKIHFLEKQSPQYGYMMYVSNNAKHNGDLRGALGFCQELENEEKSSALILN